MQITINFEKTPTPQAVAAILRDMANTWSPPQNVCVDEETIKGPKSPKKTKVKEEDMADEESEEEDLGLSDSSESEEEDEVPQITLEQVIRGFKAFVGDSPKKREQAAKILSKYKVKSVHNLKPEHYSEVLELIA